MLIHSLICVLGVLISTSVGFIFEDFASQTVFCECGPVSPEKQPNCDVSTTCQHGTWTTVKQFDMTFGFCDCELGWYGEFCELSSSLFEHPDLVRLLDISLSLISSLINCATVWWILDLLWLFFCNFYCFLCLARFIKNEFAPHFQ